MRFGGMIFKKWNTPEEWAQAALEAGYSAVYFPVDYTADSYLRLIEAIDRKGFAAHLDECRPGLGALDYETYLKCMSKLDDRTCMMLEHMTEEIDYIEATKYIKGLAKKLNIAL